MSEMKGIKLCGECINYDWKKHKCKIGCNDDSNARSSFYGDCPLPDVVPKSEVKKIFEEIEKSVALKMPAKITPIFKRGLDYSHGVIDGKREALFEVLVLIAELKEKYTGGK